MKTKAVVFNWDGVLYDSAEIYMAHFNTVLEHRGLAPLTIDDFRERISCPTAEGTFDRAGVSDIREAKAEFITLTQGEPRPTVFPDSHDTLRWLNHRDIKAFIVSAHPEADIRRLLDSYGFSGFVTGVMGDTTPENKIEYLAYVMIDLGITVDETVFVDDMDEVLKLARPIGCYLVASARGYCSYERLLKAKPDKIIHNLKNLQGYINLIDFLGQQNTPASGSPKKHSGR